jgi:hypothetical protein
MAAAAIGFGLYAARRAAKKGDEPDERDDEAEHHA